MKNLLKKKPAASAGDKPAKKALFGGLSKKKAPTTDTPAVNSNVPVNPAPKKSLFAKKAPKAPVGATPTITAEPATDATKYIPLLLGLLVLVLGALAAYMFLFKDSGEPVTEVVTPVVAPEPTTDAPVAETVTVTDTASDTEAPAEPVATAPVVEATTDAPSTETAVAQAAPVEVTYADFIEESNRKIYRERNVAPPATQTTN